MTRISTSRKLTDYSKVRIAIGNFVRGHSNFIRRKRIQGIQYLDIGCGPNTHADFVNLDYLWMPDIDVCWDITRKQLPFPDGSFLGVYTEHCFEHLSFKHFKQSMAEIYRVLKPGGTLRLIMPDGELYLDIYQRRKNGEDIRMPYEEGYISPMHRINGIFRNHGHLFIYDFETVRIILQESGFRDISKMQYMKGRDPRLLMDTADRAIESLYVEATR